MTRCVLKERCCAQAPGHTGLGAYGEVVQVSCPPQTFHKDNDLLSALKHTFQYLQCVLRKSFLISNLNFPAARTSKIRALNATGDESVSDNFCCPAD